MFAGAVSRAGRALGEHAKHVLQGWGSFFNAKGAKYAKNWFVLEFHFYVIISICAGKFLLQFLLQKYCCSHVWIELKALKPKVGICKSCCFVAR